MIVMWHKFDFVEKGEKKQIQSHMVLEGDDLENTAMAKTVGLPLGIATKLILEGKIKAKGVVAPVLKEIYEPVLDELKNFGLGFKEVEKSIKSSDKNL